MLKSAICRSLLLLALILPVAGRAADSPKPAVPDSNTQAVIADLSQRLDALQKRLDAVRDAQGEPLRQAAMEQHWDGLQEYMAASLKLAVGKPAGAEASNCSMAGGSWTPLSFPGQIRSDDYLKAMQAHLAQMRMDLFALSAARDPQAQNAVLQSHWQRNYRFLQGLRGLDWMFSGWTPAQPGKPFLPDPQSEGAKLTQLYCSLCHAVPNTRLHTASEWASVMATMARHISLSDTGFPMCVQQPSDAEFKVIGDYLQKYAR